MRLRGSSSWRPLTVADRLVRWLRVQRAADHGAQHCQYAVPDAGPALVLRTGPERNGRLRRMNILPPAGVGQAELHRRGGDAVGGAIAGELGQKLGVIGLRVTTRTERSCPQIQTGAWGGQIQSVASTLKRFFAILSSREWKETTPTRPPLASTWMAAFNPFSIASSSRLTAMRNAWKVRVAT